MVVRHGVAFHGVVLLAFGQAPMAERIVRALAVIDELGGDLVGNLTVIDLKRYRRRALAT
jgi:hypothetical protein